MAREWKNAFKCQRCPKSGGEETGCPMWLEEPFEDAHGQVTIVKGCAPRVQQYTNRWTNRRNLDVAQTVQQLRNELAQTTAALYKVMQLLHDSIVESENETESENQDGRVLMHELTHGTADLFDGLRHGAAVSGSERTPRGGQEQPVHSVNAAAG